MRKRFKTSRICSSQNYKSSVKIHREILVKNHVENTELFESIINTHKIAYTLVFGTEVILSADEVIKLQDSINIYYKQKIMEKSNFPIITDY